MRWSSSPTLPPRGCPPSPGRPDGEAPDLPDQQRLVPLQSGRQPGPGLSSQLHPTSHPRRTGKPLCATERDGSATRVLRTPGPSLPAGPGGDKPAGTGEGVTMDTNGANGGHQHEVFEKRLSPGTFPHRLDIELCICGVRRWVDQNGAPATRGGSSSD